MHSPGDLISIIEKEIAGGKLIRNPQNLYDPVNYILSLGGKRIRPVMLMMACDMFGGDLNKAIPAALGIEMFHNFSLVHDDIMDRAPLRRGKQTVHEKWDANASILSGDTMLVLSYEYFLQLDHHLTKPVLTTFSRTAREVCEGQQYDMNFETQQEVGIEDYLEMIRLKTAVLIGASFEIGSMIGGAGEKDVRLMYDFGLNAGLAFQLMDDLLDTYGDEILFGKRQYGDIRTNKKTFLYLKALELSGPGQAEELKRYYSGDAHDEQEKINSVLGIFNALDVRTRTEGLIKQYHDQALSKFSGIAVPDGNKKVILDYIGRLMARSY